MDAYDKLDQAMTGTFQLLWDRAVSELKDAGEEVCAERIREILDEDLQRMVVDRIKDLMEDKFVDDGIE